MYYGNSEKLDDNLCSECHTSCRNCVGKAPTDCTQCYSDTYLTSTKECKSECPENWYGELDLVNNRNTCK